LRQELAALAGQAGAWLGEASQLYEDEVDAANARARGNQGRLQRSSEEAVRLEQRAHDLRLEVATLGRERDRRQASLDVFESEIGRARRELAGARVNAAGRLPSKP